MKANIIDTAKERFSATARNYHLYRPSYPKALIDWIVRIAKLSPSSSIADIGCGTGIATRLFSQRGFSIIGIDPNEEMLAFARASDPKSRYQKGEAVKTGLASKSIDLITVAQAFHWFDLNPTLKEFKRILKRAGTVCAFWNIRPKTTFLEEYDALLRKFSGDYEKIQKARATIEAIKRSSMITNTQEKVFPNFQKFDLNGFIGRVYSTSYVVHGVKDHEAFKKALKKLFNKYQEDGAATFIYKTTAICWQFI